MGKPLVGETLSNQLDSLEAAFISLNTKMAVIDKVNDDQVNFYKIPEQHSILFTFLEWSRIF